MKEFPDLDLRTLILLALAGLRPKLADLREIISESSQPSTTYFSAADIHKWIYERGLDRNVNAVRNQLKKMRENLHNENIFTLEGSEGVRTVEVLKFDDEHITTTYSLSDRTVETRFPAKLMKQLGEAYVAAGGPLPHELENRIVEKIFDEFKKEYYLTEIGGVREKIDAAIDGLYFVRDPKARLKPTNRILLDENDFIDHLSRPLPPPARKLHATKRAKTKTDSTV